MKTPHKHADVIKAWADGAEVQYRCSASGDWMPATCPGWSHIATYRIKPEPKPDRNVAAWVFSDGSAMVLTRDSNVKFTFDGETGKLKAAEVL